MATADDLISRTQEFFALHWPSNGATQPPIWMSWLPFLEGSAPNYRLNGCYALMSGENLVYIGLGMNQGGGRYIEHGVSSRLSKHVLLARPEGGYRPRPQWEGHVTGIWTIGFTEHKYLAASLEIFLIQSLRPERNSTYKPPSVPAEV